MLNPLLHTSSSSCPTSPMLTRSIHVQPAAASSKAVVGANAIVAAVVARRPGAGRHGGSLMQRMSRDSSPVSLSSPSSPAVVTSEAVLTSASSGRRRLSRGVIQ